MERNCKGCGTSLVGRHPATKWCGATCKKRVQRAPEQPAVTPAPSGPLLASGLVESVESAVAQVGKSGTPLGNRAVFLARRLAVSAMDTGSAVAALDRQLGAVLAEIGAVPEGADAVETGRDELAARRAQRSA